MDDEHFISQPSSRRAMRFKAVPLRMILPNLVTLAALALGLTAILSAIDGKYRTAILLIVGAAVLDGLDGRIARALKATSRFGAELDSLADFLDFGVAPAMILYLWSLHYIKNFGWFAALIFATAAALRLARFNVAVDDPNRPAWASNFFVGMPAPAAACAALLPLYLHFSWGGFDDPSLATLYTIYLLGIAGLMVSTIPHFSGKRMSRIPREHFVPLLLAIVALGTLLAIYPMEMLAVLSVAYIIAIPFSVRRYRRYQSFEAEGRIPPSS